MSEETPIDAALVRYSRQVLFPPIGVAGQKRLRHARVALIGCGALGTVLANTLVRAGVGFIRIVDRDFIEVDNLQRQVLFDEHDIAANLPKAEAAVRKLRRVNSAVQIEAAVTDASPANIESLAGDVELLLDGTDNFETRFLINDFAVRENLPWIYGACIASEGMVMPIIPRDTPCLRCIWDQAPPPGMTPTCETAGVLASAVNVVASLQAVEATKILMGKLDELNRKLLSFDAWTGRFRGIDMQDAYDQGDCRCCKHNEYEYLSGARTSQSVTLCGRTAVQIAPPAGGDKLNFKNIAARLGHGARPAFNEFLLRFTVDAYTVTLFSDGRAIIKGTNDPAIARSVYAKYVGA